MNVNNFYHLSVQASSIYFKYFKQIGVHYGQIDLRNLKKSFMAMLSNYSYEENILKNSKKLIVNDITDNGIKIFAQTVF